MQHLCATRVAQEERGVAVKAKLSGIRTHTRRANVLRERKGDRKIEKPRSDGAKAVYERKVKRNEHEKT